MERQDGDAVGDLTLWLVELRASVGQPSLSALSELTGRIPRPYRVPKSTLGKVFQGEGLSPLPVTVAIAKACALHADWSTQQVVAIEKEARLRWIRAKTADEAERIGGKRRAVSFSADDLAFLNLYRRSVVARLDTMELFGVTLSRPDFHYPMSTSYISLNVERRGLSGREAAGPQRVEQALSGARRVLLRGDAGSGKTTLLKWLAVGSSQEKLPVAMTAWHGAIPFFLPLRSFADVPLPPPGQFLASTARTLADDAPPHFVRNALDSGRAVVLIDGVDELHADRRRDVRSWLSELIAAAPECRYVISSRQTAVDEHWLSELGFDSFELAVMNSGDQNQFIRYWHATMRAGAEDEEQRQRLDTHERALLRSLSERRELRRLAGNPLLCALLCALHWDRAMHLPDDRMKLYEAALDMLLIRRDQHRRIDDGGPTVRSGIREMLLRRLAYWMIRNDRSELSEAELVELVGRYLRQSVYEPPDAELVARQLLVRTGLLRSPAAGRVDFVHRTFQEYLAADELLNEHDLEFLINHAHEDQWQEVVVMTAGRARDRERDTLVRALLDRAADEDEHRLRLTILAVDCISGATSLDPALRVRAQRGAEELIPPQSTGQATALAGLGEVVLDLMPGPEARLPPGVVSAVLHTCRLVGGPSAMRVLARYAAEADLPVERQLRTMWDEFDLSEFARVVLSDLPWHEGLRVRGDGFAHVDHLTRLRELEVSGPADSYAVLGRTAALSSLTLTDPNPDLPDLRLPNSLRTLAVNGPVTHIAFRSLAHPGLEKLLLDTSPCPDCGRTPWQSLAEWPAEVRRGIRALTAGSDAMDGGADTLAGLLPSLDRLRIKGAPGGSGFERAASYVDSLDALPSLTSFEVELSRAHDPHLAEMVSAFPYWGPRRGPVTEHFQTWIFTRTPAPDPN